MFRVKNCGLRFGHLNTCLEIWIRLISKEVSDYRNVKYMA